MTFTNLQVCHDNPPTSVTKSQEMSKIRGRTGPSEAGGSIAPPPTFAENRAKLVNSRKFSSKIWLLPPHFWVLTPHFSVPSEGPETNTLYLVDIQAI